MAAESTPCVDTCYTEASGMPLLTFTSAPGVRKFRVEEVTIVDYGNCA